MGFLLENARKLLVEEHRRYGIRQPSGCRKARSPAEILAGLGLPLANGLPFVGGREAGRQSQILPLKRHRKLTTIGRSRCLHGLGREWGQSIQGNRAMAAARRAHQLQPDKAGQELGNRARKARGARIYWSWPQRLLGLAGASARSICLGPSRPERTGAHRQERRQLTSAHSPDHGAVARHPSDADLLGQARNGAAPSGPANSDAAAGQRVDRRGLRLLMPSRRPGAVQLPGEKPPQSLVRCIERAAALASSSVAPAGAGIRSPQRYVWLPRAALRSLVDGLGGGE